MPSATVPMCTLARSPSSRSATMRGSPVRNTSSGILRLVAKLPPGSVLRPRARAILNSSSSVGAASMMKPRSAPLTSIAESSTSASTSSSTRPEPSARSPSSSAAIWRRSPIAVVVALLDGGRAVGEQEHHLGAAAAAEPDAVAVHERPLGDLLAVDVGAVARALVAEEELVVLRRRSRRGRARPRCRPAGDRWFRAGRSRNGPSRSARCGGPARRSLRGGHRTWDQKLWHYSEVLQREAEKRRSTPPQDARGAARPTAAPSARPAASCRQLGVGRGPRHLPQIEREQQQHDEHDRPTRAGSAAA